MLLYGKVCVPEAMMHEVVYEYHAALGHRNIRCLVSRSTNVQHEVRKIVRACSICKACEPANWKTNLSTSFSPIPDYAMASVALNIFALPKFQWAGQSFDSLLVC